jgi:hypothetical protein
MFCAHEPTRTTSLLPSPRFAAGTWNKKFAALDRGCLDAWFEQMVSLCRNSLIISRAGFDLEGQQQLVKLSGTHKWIGTSGKVSPKYL